MLKATRAFSPPLRAFTCLKGFSPPNPSRPITFLAISSVTLMSPSDPSRAYEVTRSTARASLSSSWARSCVKTPNFMFSFSIRDPFWIMVGTLPLKALSRVLFPAPLGPLSNSFIPRGIVRLIFFSRGSLLESYPITASFNTRRFSPCGLGGGGNESCGMRADCTTATGGGSNFPSFFIFSSILTRDCADLDFVPALNLSMNFCKLAASSRFFSYSACADNALNSFSSRYLL
mmetsp:Transcript_28024/g.39395  ORF Transcript_28024/g.39395 Transcript_28024/m.39395 type:complete len:232 (-) Transcript_28024:969-1664(-)